MAGSTNLPPNIQRSVNFRNFAKLYRKIPKISPGSYIFQRSFLRGLYLEGLIFGILRYLRSSDVSLSNLAIFQLVSKDFP